MEPQTDTLYQAYGKDLYKLTGEEQEDSILDIMNADQTASNADSVETNANDIASANSVATIVTATGSIQVGKTTFDNS